VKPCAWCLLHGIERNASPPSVPKPRSRDVVQALLSNAPCTPLLLFGQLAQPSRRPHEGRSPQGSTLRSKAATRTSRPRL